MKINEKDYHVQIESTSNTMDLLQGIIFPKVWTVLTWACAEALGLAPHLDVLPT
jgi:hypothetical protein